MPPALVCLSEKDDVVRAHTEFPQAVPRSSVPEPPSPTPVYQEAGLNPSTTCSQVRCQYALFMYGF